MQLQISDFLDLNSTVLPKRTYANMDTTEIQPIAIYSFLFKIRLIFLNYFYAKILIILNISFTIF